MATQRHFVLAAATFSLLTATFSSIFQLAAAGSTNERLDTLGRGTKSLDALSGGEVLRDVHRSRALDPISGGEVIRALDPLSGGEVIRALDPISGGEVIRALDPISGGEVIRAVDQFRYPEETGVGYDRRVFVRHLYPTSEDTILRDALYHSRGKRSPERLSSENQPQHSATKRGLDTLSGLAFGVSKKLDSLSGLSFGRDRRNFDEIDNVGFHGFAKRNLDDNNGFSKRNFDEIDRAGFGGFSKRNFDEIDRAGFGGFYKRNFDEIDRSGFEGFYKRNFDEIDRSGFGGFFKRDKYPRYMLPGVSPYLRPNVISSSSRFGSKGAGTVTKRNVASSTTPVVKAQEKSTK